MNRITPLILAVALFMENMDSTVIATSLPAIAADIGTDPIALKLAFTAYFVALAIFIPVSGWIADRFGANTVFRMAIGIFVVGSLCCAASYSLETFVASRFLQGFGASMMTPIARLVLVRVTPRSELVGAMAWLTLPGLIGPMVGPPLGGFITTIFTWHWIFLINVPIGLIGIVLASKFLPKIEKREPRPLDKSGFLLCAIWFSGLIFGLSVISLPALPPIAGIGSAVIGLLAGAAYLVSSRRKSAPLLDFRLLRKRLYRVSVLSGAIFRTGLGALPFLLPLMLQLGFGMTPLESGLITFASAVGAMFSKVVAERLFAAVGFKWVLTFAIAIASLTMVANAFFGPETPAPLIMGCLLIGGVMRSIFFSGNNAMGYAGVADNEVGQATAITAVTQQISIALGVAIAGGVLELSANITGGPVGLDDFHVAWVAVSALSAIAMVFYFGLPRDAGSDISGQKRRQRG
ncbi:MFS transporter [Devosia enhydra]|uniref:MFS transporter n=1 Tax=Devosia enhydra TaxID=665118 RepID=UPI0009318286|nr:MFS transporter [Devosia enhydra]